MKMTMSTASPMTPRLHHRKVLRLAGKRPGAHHRTMSGKGRPCVRQAVDACDNSDDSGLGFDHPMDIRALHYGERNTWVDDVPEIKRRKYEVKLENDETNDNYCFPEPLKNCKDNTTIIRAIPSTGIPNLGRAVTHNGNSNKAISRCLPLISRRAPASGPVTLATQLTTTSRNGKIQLQIVSQPEQQHRARYQTEGSRGAVKDRSGNGFPIVKLIGYDKPATLQVFIGTDQGRVAPHMFYQACRVSGKNSTPCVEKKIDGTIVIEVELDPTKEMVATCDCVGILKERNVDVEHRFPEQLGSRSKKKSTRCRMVFRTTITNEDGTSETLQVCSQPIVCTQPPGVPEICKKSLTTCPANGGLELFILGKNFLKDTRVVFQQPGNMFENTREKEVIWQECVAPDKEYLQQTHLVCVIPPYVRQDITEPVTVRLYVLSSGKNSEPQNFVYTPAVGPAVRLETTAPTTAPFLSKMLWQTGTTKQEMNLGMMPPPTTLVPVSQRRSSTILDNHHSPPMSRSMKTELMDENSQGSIMDHIISESSVDSMRQRFRALSENSSLDVAVHQDENSMTINGQEIINENSKNNISTAISENSVDMNSFKTRQNSFHCDASNSNHSIHNEEKSILVNNTINLVPNINSTRDNLKGIIDLRISTLNDLADTQSPSLATLRKFVVTESTNIPLPTQTGQSVESFLTTLENTVNKPVLSNTVANNIKDDQILKSNTNLLDGKIEINTILNQSLKHLLSNTAEIQGQNNVIIQGTNKMFNNTLSEIMPAINESHIKTSDRMMEVMFNGQPTPTEVLKPNLILTQQSLVQAALSSNMLSPSTATPKLDALVNSAVDSHIGSPQQQEIIAATSPQEISPLIQTPEILINPSEVLLAPQAPLLSSTIAPGSEILLHPPQQEITTTQDVILNPQVSPTSVICRQDALLTGNLNGICASNCLQASENPLSNHLNIAMKQVDCIVMNGSNHHILVEQQKTAVQNQNLINTLFENATTTVNTQEGTHDLLMKNLLTQTFVEASDKPGSEFLNPPENVHVNKAEVKQPVRQTPMEMIPHTLTNMSENDLISYINPSCFDAEGTYPA